jgi:hypothetical protein
LSYTILYFTYISIYTLKYGAQADGAIDYAALLDVLSKYPSSKKRQLNSIFSSYNNHNVADYRAMFDEELAPFNMNDGPSRMEDDFKAFAEAIYKNIKNFAAPTFYLLDHQILAGTYHPNKFNRHKNWCAMGFYLASLTEIHFFVEAFRISIINCFVSSRTCAQSGRLSTRMPKVACQFL